MRKVSIVIPLYNMERYVEECVRSAIEQTYLDTEVIVVDDGSTDGSPEIVKRFADRIKIIRQENQGPSKALNTGILAGTGEYIAWMGADDVFLPEKTARQVEVMEAADKSVGVLYSDAMVIDAQGRMIRRQIAPAPPEAFVSSMLKHGMFVNGATTLTRRECFEKVGLFNEDLWAACDGDMWFRISRHYRFHHIPQILVKYRWHPGNTSHNKKLIFSCKDKVYAAVVEGWPMEELFPGAEDFAREYEQMAKCLAMQLCRRASRLSLSRAAQSGRWSPSRRLMSSLVLRITSLYASFVQICLIQKLLYVASLIYCRLTRVFRDKRQG